MARTHKTCKSCGEKYKVLPVHSPFQCWCGIDCGVELGRKRQAIKREKAAKADHKARKEKIKTRGDYLRDAQKEFNRFTRERDYMEPCISCQRHHPGQYHAGHYRSVGAAPELRFTEANVHKQCAPCNNHKSGNPIEYRINLVKKIGLELVEYLEGPHPPLKLSIEEIKHLQAEYRRKANQLQKERV